MTPTGSAPDVLISTKINDGLFHQFLRVANACEEVDLKVQFVEDGFHPDSKAFGDAFRGEGFEVIGFPARTWRSGPLAYPSIPATIQMLRSLRKEWRGFRPGLVLTHTDAAGVWRALHAWAQESGVGSAVLQEGSTARFKPGFAPWRPRGLRLLGNRLLRRFGPKVVAGDRRIYEFADHALVWGQALRTHLLERGRDRQTISVVGNPGLDHLNGRASLAPVERRAVLFAQQPQPNEEEEFEACRHIIRTCVDGLRCQLLFRPHPRGAMGKESILELASATAAPDLVEVVDSGDVIDHLPRASVLITYYSTVAYHAAIAGVPLVLADWVSPTYELDAPEYGAALSIQGPVDLEATLRRALDDETARQDLHRGAGRWLEYHLGILDGRAAERTASVIRRLIRG